MLLSIAYFPPVSWFALVARDFTLSSDGVKPSKVTLEACEHYRKQTWRNRFRFLAADGPQCLNYPVVHDGQAHLLPITEIRVDYSVPWVIKTERAIAAAYESSAFFDYYKDELFAILDSHPDTLFDLDLQIINFFIRKIGLAVEFDFTTAYVAPGLIDDYREAIHPKRPDTILKDLGLERPYFQVFSQKHGFVPNLSIMDLLFNEGPNSISYLTNSLKVI